MSCDPYFSLWRLSESSLESEMTYSPRCLPNSLKVSIYAVYLFAMCVSFVLALAQLIRGFVASRAWTPTKRAMVLLVFIFACEIVKHGIMLAGGQTIAKYFFSTIPPMLSYILAFYMVRDWYRAMSMIERGGNSPLDGVLRRFDVGMWVSLSYIFTGFIIMWMIGPMVTSPVNPTMSNWFFIFGYLHHACGATLCAGYFLYFGSILAKMLRPSLEAVEFKISDQKIVRLLKKLQFFLMMIKFILVSMTPMFLLPLWMVLTVSPTSPGLDYFFIMEFGFGTLTKLCGNLLLFWFAKRNEGGISFSSSEESEQESESRKTSAKFPSYGVDELSPRTSTVQVAMETHGSDVEK